MARDAAWRMIEAAFRCGRELQELLQFLKAKLGTNEYKPCAIGIATAVDTINDVQLIDRALKVHPEIEDKIEADLVKTGRIS